MRSIEYPNGQTLVSTALTQQQVAQLLATLTCGVLGINPPDFSQVRMDWQPEGQPFQNQPQNMQQSTQGVPQDVTYVAASIWNTSYSKVRDQGLTTPAVTEEWIYTKGWRIAWVFYGPNAADNARAVWSATFMDYFSQQLQASSLFVVTDPDAPTWNPENINGQWFPRTDFYVNLYEQVTETILDGVAKNVEVKIYEPSISDTEPAVDVTITA